LAVRHARAVADHPAQAALGWEHLSHAGRLYLSDEERNRVALGLEYGPLHVAEVLPVGLQRTRPVARDLDPVDVVRRDGAGGSGQAATGEDPREHARNRP